MLFSASVPKNAGFRGQTTVFRATVHEKRPKRGRRPFSEPPIHNSVVKRGRESTWRRASVCGREFARAASFASIACRDELALLVCIFSCRQTMSADAA